MDKDKFDFLINGEKLSIEFGELAKSLPDIENVIEFQKKRA